MLCLLGRVRKYAYDIKKQMPASYNMDICRAGVRKASKTIFTYCPVVEKNTSKKVLCYMTKLYDNLIMS